MTTPAGASVWRLYEIDGVPASGPHRPVKSEVIAWAGSLEGEMADALSDVALALAAVSSVAPLPNGLIVGQIPKTSTVTISIASPGVVTWSAHGLLSMSPVVFSTTGALPTGLIAGAIYYVCAGASLLTNSFRVANSIANAITGTAINTSGTQSGTHTALANGEYPIGYKGRIKRSFRQFDNLLSIPHATDTLVLQLSLEAGIYLTGGQAALYGGSGVTLASLHASHDVGITNITSGLGDGANTAFHINSNHPNGYLFPLSIRPIVLTSTQNLNLVAQADFAGGANTGFVWGGLFALQL